MYKASFLWYQDTKYPIYSQLLKPIIESSSSMGSSSFNTSTEKDNKIPIRLDFDIIEDFTYEIKSNYQNYGDILSSMPFVGSLMTYVEMGNNLSGLSGTSTASSDHMKFQTWKETEPFKMNFKFILSNYSDPFIDVYAPAMAMSSMSILSPVPTEDGKGFKFKTPGVNSYAIGGLNRNEQVKDKKNASGSSGDTLAVMDATAAQNSITDMLRSSSKIIKEFIIWSEKVDGGTSFKQSGMLSTIPGNPLLIVKDCFIESAKPTWAKDRTASGIPIWCELELGIQSIFSANDSMFSYLTKTSNYTGIGDAAKKVATNIFR